MTQQSASSDTLWYLRAYDPEALAEFRRALVPGDRVEVILGREAGPLFAHLQPGVVRAVVRYESTPSEVYVDGEERWIDWVSLDCILPPLMPMQQPLGDD